MNDFKLPKIYDADGCIDQQWFVFYYYLHPETRKWVRFRIFISKKLKTKSERYDRANEIKNEIKKKLLSGHDPFANSQSKSSLKAALNLAVALKLKTTAIRTAFTYRSVVNLFLSWAEKNNLSGQPVDCVTKKVIQRYLDHSISVEKISNRTYNNRIRSLKTIFNELLFRDYIVINPVIGIKQLKTCEPAITAYNDDELQRISEILPTYNYQLYVISQLIFYCFLRPAEIVRLQFRDVNWDQQMINIPGKKSKNGETETVVVPDKLRENLKDWILDYPGEWYLFGRMLNPGPFKISPNRIGDWWRTFKKKYNLTKNIYDMKHTGNGMAFDLDINPRDIQLQNRHYSLDQTQQYLNKFRRKASEKFVKNFTGY